MRLSMRPPSDRRPPAKCRAEKMFDRASEYRAALRNVTMNIQCGPLGARCISPRQRRRIETTPQRVIATTFLHCTRDRAKERARMSPRKLPRQLYTRFHSEFSGGV